MKKTAFTFVVLFAAAFVFNAQAQGTGNAAKGAAGGAAFHGFVAETL